MEASHCCEDSGDTAALASYIHPRTFQISAEGCRVIARLCSVKACFVSNQVFFITAVRFVNKIP